MAARSATRTWLCTDACTIEPDLAEPNLEYGAYCCCPSPLCAEEERRQKAEEERRERQRDAMRRLCDDPSLTFDTLMSIISRMTWT